jgi:PKD repeat protein
MAVGAAPAQAAVNYCVNLTPCPDNGQAKPTIESAISATPHADEIDIGPGTYSPSSAGSGFHIPDGRNITFIGSGRSRTILTASGTPIGVLEASGSTGHYSVAQMTIDMPAGASTGLLVPDQVLHVDVEALGPTSGNAIHSGNTIARDIRIDEPPGSTGIGYYRPNGVGDVDGAVIRAGIGIGGFGNNETYRNVRITTDGIGIDLREGGSLQTLFENVQISLTGPGIGIRLAATFNSSVPTLARLMTIQGSGDPASTGVEVESIEGVTNDVTVTNSIITGVGHSLRRHASGAASSRANLTVRHSSFNPFTAVDDSSNGGPIDTNSTDIGDAPQLVAVANGDLFPEWDSPVIDAGKPNPLNPAAPATDLAGNTRVVNGRIDMGAFEYQRRAPVAAASASGTAPTRFDASGSSDADPGDTLTYSWSFDDGATATGAVVDHGFAAPGPHTGTVTVTDPTGQTATASASVTSTGVPALPRPVLSGLKLSHKVFRLGSRLASLAAKKPPVGTTITFTLSAAAKVKLAFSRKLSGRKPGKRCVAPTHHNRHAKRCTRTRSAGSLTLNGHSGADKVKFQGRISRHRKLKPGRYTVKVTASNAGGSSAVRSASFKVVKG